MQFYLLEFFCIITILIKNKMFNMLLVGFSETPVNVNCLSVISMIEINHYLAITYNIEDEYER